MTKDEALHLANILQAYAEGEAIEVLDVSVSPAEWRPLPYDPTFNTRPADRYRIAKPVHTGWINIYDFGNGQRAAPTLHPTKEAAVNNSTSHRVACIQISYREGEGL